LKAFALDITELSPSRLEAPSAERLIGRGACATWDTNMTASSMVGAPIQSNPEAPNPLLRATPVFALLSFLSQWPGAPEQDRYKGLQVEAF
jgi:hypothetical protein